MRKPVRGIEDNTILTPNQKRLLQAFSRSDLREVYRLTGGTALSAFYLEHRSSEDLDFFSSEKIPLVALEAFVKTLDFVEETHLTKLYDRNLFLLKPRSGGPLKVEFTYYPLMNIEDPVTIGSLRVDSFTDIVVNKLCAIADRIEAKDYLDVYCAIKQEGLLLSVLIDLAERKCEIKGIRHILQSRLLQIPDSFEALPMKWHIRKKEVEAFFKGLVKKLVEKTIL